MVALVCRAHLSPTRMCHLPLTVCCVARQQELSGRPHIFRQPDKRANMRRFSGLATSSPRSCPFGGGGGYVRKVLEKVYSEDPRSALMKQTMRWRNSSFWGGASFAGCLNPQPAQQTIFHQLMNCIIEIDPGACISGFGMNNCILTNCPVTHLHDSGPKRRPAAVRRLQAGA